MKLRFIEVGIDEEVGRPRGCIQYRYTAVPGKDVSAHRLLKDGNEVTVEFELSGDRYIHKPRIVRIDPQGNGGNPASVMIAAAFLSTVVVSTRSRRRGGRSSRRM